MFLRLQTMTTHSTGDGTWVYVETEAQSTQWKTKQGHVDSILWLQGICSIVFIMLKFREDSMKVFQGRGLNFGAVVNGCCTTTSWHLLFPTFVQKIIWQFFLNLHIGFIWPLSTFLTSQAQIFPQGTKTTQLKR